MADYLKIPAVARRLDVSEPTVRRMVKGGKLPSVFVGGAYRVSETDLAEYLESAKVTPGVALFVEPEEGEEPEVVTLRLYTVRLMDERDRLLQRVRELERERDELRQQGEKPRAHGAI